MSYPNNLYNLHNDLLFMCEKRKINGVQKLVPNLKHKLVLDKFIGQSNLIKVHG